MRAKRKDRGYGLEPTGKVGGRRRRAMVRLRAYAAGVRVTAASIGDLDERALAASFRNLAEAIEQECSILA